MKFKRYILMATALMTLLALFALSATKPTCTPVDPVEPVCKTPEDCDGLPHIMCLGEWQCEKGQCLWDCAPACLGQGETFIATSGDEDLSKKCCPGLDPVKDAVENDDGSCSWPKCMCYVCTSCGDGSCDKGENACNCPEDCKTEPQKCEEGGGTCKDSCGSTEKELDLPCGVGAACCAPGVCDDGTMPACKMMTPVCTFGTILAVQEQCWKCVDPDTCEEPDMCGGIAGFQCEEGETCNMSGCYPDAAGVCVEAIEMCTKEYAPVCGCDGKTYGNDCMRVLAGMALDHIGACESTEMCGGIAGLKCDEGEICDIHGCYPDAAGTCVEKQELCTKEYAPVCGCDGITYDNDCFRIMAGAPFDHKGECKPEITECEKMGGGCYPWTPDYTNCPDGTGPAGYMCENKSQVCCMKPEPQCKQLDPNGYGMCEMLLGVVFDGKGCVYASGCGCDDDCAEIFQTMEECETACLPQPDCVIPDGYDPVPLNELIADPKKYDGKTVYSKGDVKTGMAICTLMACSPDNPCCNSCGASMSLNNSEGGIELGDGDVTGVGCGGNECTYMQNCKPFQPDPGYTMWGTVKYQYEAMLMVDGWCGPKK